MPISLFRLKLNHLIVTYRVSEEKSTNFAQNFKKMQNIAVFGSGSGSNAENIIRFFSESSDVKIGPLVSNTSKSRFRLIAEANAIDYLEFDNTAFENEIDLIIENLQEYKTDWIVLAGFLRKIHPKLIQAFENRIINIHPSLLPQYGGPGMYGMRVHQAVFDHNETESGITVHFVNEHFDEGEIIAQKKVNVETCANPDEIRAKVQELEQLYFPQIINDLIQ